MKRFLLIFSVLLASFVTTVTVSSCNSTSPSASNVGGAGQWTDGVRHNPSGASVQCLGTTTKNVRCQNTTKNTSGYCYLHE